MSQGEQAKGSAGIQGQLWSARPRDWAELEDEGSRPIFESVLDATGVGKGTNYLDVGCGSGLACAIAEARGARVSGLDAASGLLAIAGERVPSADFKVGDMQFSLTRTMPSMSSLFSTASSSPRIRWPRYARRRG